MDKGRVRGFAPRCQVCFSKEASFYLCVPKIIATNVLSVKPPILTNFLFLLVSQPCLLPFSHSADCVLLASSSVCLAALFKSSSEFARCESLCASPFNDVSFLLHLTDQLLAVRNSASWKNKWKDINIQTSVCVGLMGSLYKM